MNLLFSFFGRTGRGGFWLGVLAWIVTVAIFVGLGFLLFGPPMTMVTAAATTAGTETVVPADPDGLNGAQAVFNYPSMAVAGLGYLAALWISLATQVKRCHDRGFSGWWVIPMNIVPFWSLISLGVLEGQDGPNQYGPDPRAATA
jgi:uncharacterized membrane protein YhaH (DUF805 family)